ncbi:MAG: type II toxin-antitoxin system prevent-host-death family antitoxin [Candidatus Angelobacter sp.]
MPRCSDAESSSKKIRARCLAILDRVQKTKEAVLITKSGRPVAKLVPAEESPREFLGRLEGMVKIIGDIESPVEHADAWDAAR